MARVTVNRIWQQVFGIGLVKTAEDFGVQAETPVHRELLDWLAAEFRDSGWNVKALMRLILSSETYLQSSNVSDELARNDPQNRLLARGARFRLPAWMIRDQALAASGLLSPRSGGAPVKPYQPAGVWEEATFGNKRYVQGKGEDLHRRSLFTFWRRIVAPTMFFDAANRAVCTVKPLRTNTPLHALNTLNDPTFVEAARLLVLLDPLDALQLRVDHERPARAARDDGAVLRRHRVGGQRLVVPTGHLSGRRENEERIQALLGHGHAALGCGHLALEVMQEGLLHQRDAEALVEAANVRDEGRGEQHVAYEDIHLDVEVDDALLPARALGAKRRRPPRESSIFRRARGGPRRHHRRMRPTLPRRLRRALLVLLLLPR
jgi:hypothetical protein